MTNLRNTKRALLSSVVALFICFSMLLGTTFAWFTDSVTSSGNIIQSGNLNAEMYWALATEEFADATWNDVEDEQTEKIFTHTNWEPGYVDAKHIKVVNNGSLAFNYKIRITASDVVSELANVIDVYVVNHNDDVDEDEILERADLVDGIKIGTLMDVIGTDKNLTNTIKGSILANGAPQYWTIALKMQETANDDYQGMDLGSEFDIQLIATQMSNEADSFGPDYDLNDPDNNIIQVPDPELPAALVTAINTKIPALYSIDDAMDNDEDTCLLRGSELDAAYQFAPTETAEEAEMSKYRYWHADFVVKADTLVSKDSMALAGYYKAFDDAKNLNGAWVAIPVTEDVAANTEIRLLDLMGFSVNYEEIGFWGNDGIGFQCGLIDWDGKNAGTTVTVELRIYETTKAWNATSGTANVETGVYETIGTFKYTFPAVEVADQTELDAAIANGVSDVDLAAGNYTIGGYAFQGKEMTIRGTKETVIDANISVNNQFVTNANMVFDGVTVNFGTENYLGLANVKSLTFKNCTINGYQYLYGENIVFENCVFNSTGYSVCVYDADNVTFKNCKFNTNGKAVLLYKDDLVSSTYNVTVEDCEFNATAPGYAGAIANQACAAIEIHNYGASYNVKVSNVVVDNNFSGVWRIKTFETNGTTVTVNDVAYNTLALDGKTMTIDADKNVTVNN